MVPQVLAFVFLSLTAAVGVWQNLLTSRFTLGTAWCVTNALILGAFILVALGEGRGAGGVGGGPDTAGGERQLSTADDARARCRTSSRSRP